MGSNAVSSSAVSRIVGYVIQKGNFASQSPNLPQSIAILSEGNDDNQDTMPTDGTVITSAQQAGNLYGYGSPIYHIARILLPVNGGGIAGIPITVFACAAAGGSTNTQIEITPTGTANANGTHWVCIGGREGIDGTFYEININQGDSTSEISAKIQDAVNGVLGAPVTASSTDYEASLASKWKGATSAELLANGGVTIDTGTNDLGITYTVTTVQTGTGTPSIAGALSQFGNVWYTKVINGFGTNTDIMTALENFNGIPAPDDQTPPTGRFTGIIMKPFQALTGSTADDPSSITDPRSAQVTIAICPAPNSPGFTFEAAANVCALDASLAQDSPAQDIGGSPYPDMPVISNTAWANASMSSYNNRNTIVQKGCSTVDLINGQWVMQDYITTYHPMGEVPPQFRYVRNLNVDFNIRFQYYILEQIHVIGKIIANNNDIVNSPNVVKPKDWTGVLFTLANTLVSQGLITDAQFMQNSIDVEIDSSNPDRFDTSFSYKRTGTVRIAATTATAGFYFGS